MKRLSILAVAIAMLHFGNFAQAQRPGGKDKNPGSKQAGEQQGQRRGDGQKRGGGLFRLLDSDRDGKLSPEEIDGAVAALKRLDTNKDGALDLQELAAGGAGGRPGQGERRGQNKDSRNRSTRSND